MVSSLLTLMLVSMGSFLTNEPSGTTIHSPARNATTITVDDLANSSACDFVYGFDIQALFGIETDVVGEERIRVELLSTCSYRWLNKTSGVTEHLELWLEVNPENPGSADKFTKDLESKLNSGELRHPMKPQQGRFKYEEIEGPGDLTIWCSESRALRWHLKDDYYFIMNLDEKVSPRSADQDLEKMIALASQINERMGL